MKIVLATSNLGKVKEIKALLKDHEIYALSEILTPFEIVEDGISFKENALIKSRAVFEALRKKGLENEFISLSDDSGISVEALGFAPGIYSARYSGANATDASNRAKLIANLNALNLDRASAFYTACIGINCVFGEYSAHGFMYGDVINKERGESGFGYDFMFIPRGFDKTIGELDERIKSQISHRAKALKNAEILLNFIQKRTKFLTFI